MIIIIIADKRSRLSASVVTEKNAMLNGIVNPINKQGFNGLTKHCSALRVLCKFENRDEWNII